MPNRLHDVLDQGRRIGDAEVRVKPIDALARRASQRGEATTAPELLRAADDFAPAAGYVGDGSDRVDADCVRARLAGNAEPPQLTPRGRRLDVAP